MTFIVFKGSLDSKSASQRKGQLANSREPDRTPQKKYAASDQVFHCSQIIIYYSPGISKSLWIKFPYTVYWKSVILIQPKMHMKLTIGKAIITQPAFPRHQNMKCWGTNTDKTQCNGTVAITYIQTSKELQQKNCLGKVSRKATCGP